MTSQETGTTEEIRALKQQMTDMYEAWMSGQPPPSLIRDYFDTNMSPLSMCRQVIRYIPLDSAPMITHPMSLKLLWCALRMRL